MNIREQYAEGVLDEWKRRQNRQAPGETERRGACEGKEGGRGKGTRQEALERFKEKNAVSVEG